MFSTRVATLIYLMVAVAVLAGTAMRPVFAADDALTAMEKVAKDFAEGRLDRVYTSLSPSLQSSMSQDTLKQMRASLVQRGGSLRYVQAAYYLSNPKANSTINQAAVPIDFDRNSIELMMTWDRSDPKYHLIGFAARPASNRPRTSPSGPLQVEFRDPQYVNTSRFDEVPVRFGKPNLPLEGILTIPTEANQTPVPAVLLLPDRMMSDADGTIGRVRPLRDVAGGLGTWDVLSLRFPRRFTVYTDQEQAAYTIDEDLLEDAQDALTTLIQQPQTDKRFVYIVGFGFGADIAAELAGRIKGVHGIVLISPPAAYDVDYMQSAMEVTGYLDTLSDADRAVVEGAIPYLKNQSLPPDRRIADAPASFWYSAMKLDPVKQLAEFRGPSLLMFGGADKLLTTREFEKWGDLDRRRPNIALRFYPTFNRWMMPSRLSGDPAETYLPSHVDGSVIDMIAAFVKAPTP